MKILFVHISSARRHFLNGKTAGIVIIGNDDDNSGSEGSSGVANVNTILILCRSLLMSKIEICRFKCIHMRFNSLELYMQRVRLHFLFIHCYSHSLHPIVM